MKFLRVTIFTLACLALFGPTWADVRTIIIVLATHRAAATWGHLFVTQP